MAKKVTAQEATPEVVKTSTDLRTTVANALAAIGPKRQVTLVDKLVEKDLNRQVTALEILYGLINRKKKELNRIRADVTHYNGAGEPLEPVWTKPKLEEKKKAEQELEKLEKVFNKALSDEDFVEVYKITDNKKPDDSSDGGSSE